MAANNIINGHQFTPGANLQNTVLPRGEDLHGLDLHGIHLENSTLNNINLEGCNLQGAFLNNCRFLDSNLRGANLRGAHLQGASFTGADLRDVDLEGADLDNGSFYGADLRGVLNLDRALNFQSIGLSGADLRDIPNLFLFFENIFIPGIDFSSVNLGGIDLQNADLQNINLEGANLQGTEFLDANLQGADLRSTQCGDANFEGANLQGANLRYIRINERTNFQGADLRGARISRGQRFVGAIMNNNDEDTSDDEYDEYDEDDEPARGPPQGRAFEVHNYFNTLDINAIRDFIQEFNKNNNDVNRITISRSAASQEQQLFTPLLNFIDNSDLFKSDEKAENKEKLNRILSIAQGYEGFNENKELLNSIIEFVSKQNDDFIEQYIRIIKDECLNAYGKGGESCIKGMFERIVTILGTVAITLTQDGVSNQENETYKTLKKLFREINFSELVQEWSATYLEGGEKEEELKSLSIEQRKAHFINFITTKYGALITPIITAKILEEANEYERTGLFERLYFGGKRKTRKTNKKRKNIKKKTKKIRKTKNVRKTMKKRKTIKNRRSIISYKKK